MMANAAIPFAEGESAGLEELNGGHPASVNAVADATGAVTTRPGISAWEDFPETAPSTDPVTAIASWNEKLVYVTQNAAAGTRVIAAVVAPQVATVVNDSTGSPNATFFGLTRPVITTTRTRAVIATGGYLQSWSGAAFSFADMQLFVDVSHVAAISQRLVASSNNVSGLVYWSGVGDVNHTSWTTGRDFLEAEFKPDAATGLYATAGELAVLGPRTIQMLAPDPGVTFSPSRSMDIGCAAPHSFVAYNEEFFLLSHQREFIRSNGRSYASVSDPQMTKLLDNLTVVSDCWGFRAKFGASDIVAWQFPTDGLTLAYDVSLKRWSEWRGYSAGAWAGWAPTSYYYWPERKLHLVGMPDGRIMKLDVTADTDAGEPIVSEMRTAFISHKTGSQKLNQRLHLRFRRGTVAGEAESFAELSWRDDLGEWEQPEYLSLGTESDVEPVITLYSLGVYRQRQWRLRVGGKRYTFAGAEEIFEVLEG